MTSTVGETQLCPVRHDREDGRESDYEVYLRCTELLGLQKPPEQRAHRDELLFQVVHQTSELWLKLAVDDAGEAGGLMARNRLHEAAAMLRRAGLPLAQITAGLHLLETMSPWDYTVIRRALGQGSGFGSPGFRSVRGVSRALRKGWEELLGSRRLDAAEVYRHRRRHEELYAMAEAMIEWDERLMLWRAHHLRMVKRVIGGGAVGTAGTPVQQLALLLDQEQFPELWEVRNELTRQAGL